MTKSVSVLTVNAGSSSIKLALYQTPDTRSKPTKEFDLKIEGMGQDQTSLVWQIHGQDEVVEGVQANDNQAAQAIVLDKLHERLDGRHLDGIGHRVVHGGPDYHESIKVDEKILKNLDGLKVYDPEHMPAALGLVNEFQEIFPQTPQFASFDTGFFHDLPKVAQLLPLPRRFYEEGLRKYGFHGLSYRYVYGKLKELSHGEHISKTIVAHLGSGASLAAIKDGKPIDTTMAFTPVSGIPMSTRSGDIDPGIVSYLQKRYQIGTDDFNQMVNQESGLLGVSGMSANMYTLLQNQADSPAAADAVELFCYHTRRAIGSLAAALGGVDSLVFSGGIGEKSAEIRQRICAELHHLGLEIDDQANNRGDNKISDRLSGVSVYIIPTDESLIIAQDTLALLGK